MNPEDLTPIHNQEPVDWHRIMMYEYWSAVRHAAMHNERANMSDYLCLQDTPEAKYRCLRLKNHLANHVTLNTHWPKD